jgi:plasmid stabilization system protein ParE
VRRYSVRRAADVTRDLDRIEDHLVETYQEFGENLETAVERATIRVDDALSTMRGFVTHPRRGTERAKIRPGLRTVTNGSGHDDRGLVASGQAKFGLGGRRLTLDFKRTVVPNLFHEPNPTPP